MNYVLTLALLLLVVPVSAECVESDSVMCLYNDQIIACTHNKSRCLELYEDCQVPIASPAEPAFKTIESTNEGKRPMYIKHTKAIASEPFQIDAHNVFGPMKHVIFEVYDDGQLLLNWSSVPGETISLPYPGTYEVIARRKGYHNEYTTLEVSALPPAPLPQNAHGAPILEKVEVANKTVDDTTKWSFVMREERIPSPFTVGSLFLGMVLIGALCKWKKNVWKIV